MALYEPKIFPRFRDYAPALAIPSVYWDVESAEQRIRNICEILGRVVSYADEMGVEVTSISQALADIEAGHLDPLIIEAIEDWFEENEPTITAQIGWLNSILPQTAFNATNTVKWYIDQLSEEMGGLAQGVANHGRNLVTLNNLTDEHEREITELQGTTATHTTQIGAINEYIGTNHYIATIGDSFGNEAGEWPQRLAEWSGFRYQLINKCTNSAGFTTGPKTFEQQFNEIAATDQWANGLIDYVVLFGGVNDWNDAHATVQEMSAALESFKTAWYTATNNAPAGKKPKLIFAVGNCGWARSVQYIGYDQWVRQVQRIGRTYNIPGIVNNVQYWLMCETISHFQDDYLHPSATGENLIASYLAQCITGTYDGVHRVYRTSGHTNAVSSGATEVHFDNGLVSVCSHLTGVSAPLDTEWTELVTCNTYCWAFGSGDTTSETETAFITSPIHQLFVNDQGVGITEFVFNVKLGRLWLRKFGSRAAIQTGGGYGANWTGSPSIVIPAGFAM